MAELLRVTRPGSYAMPAKHYHADPCLEPSLSSSIAKTLLAHTPLHAWFAHPRLNPDHEPVNKTAFDIGTACHTLLLGKGNDIVHVEADAYTTKVAREARDAAWERGATPLTTPQLERVQDMHNAARFQLTKHSVGNPFEAAGGQSEMAFFAELGGVWCRCMTDRIIPHDGVVYDYKTTSERANVEHLQRRIANLGYDLQAAFYLDILEALGMRGFRWRFVMQESEPPYALAVVQLNDDWLAMARRKSRRAVQLWRLCLETFGTDPWPGYPASLIELAQPIWAERQQLEREELEADYRRATGKDILAAAMAWQAPT